MSVDKIKAKLNIVEVIGSYIKLEKAGLNYRARCPFHNEKTPSFMVSPSRQSFHCFGCNKGGDMFTFVQEIEGLDFIEALKNLADRAGVPLESFAGDQSRKNETEPLFAVMAEAVDFCRRKLAENPNVLDYLRSRGLADATIKDWGIGFAPDGWRHLYDFLFARGRKPDDMEKAGLVVAPPSSAPRGSRHYDRFRSRIMFPIANGAGKTVAFSGRIFGDNPKEAAKYINSPQTSIFDKSKILYGFDKAKVEIKKADAAVLVEGQVDLVMSHQAGVGNTIATSGTALTEEHLHIIKRLTDNLILAYDYDPAGLKASWRAINMAKALDMNVRIAKLPDGQDPADVVRDNPEVWVAAVRKAKHHIDFMIDALMSQGKAGLDLALAVNSLVLPYVKALDKKMEQAHFVAKLADILSLPEQAIWDDMKKISEPEIAPISSPALRMEPVRPTGKKDGILRRLFGLLFWLGKDDLERELVTLLGPEIFDTKKEEFSTDREKLIWETELSYGSTVDPEKEFVGLALGLKEEELLEEQRELTRKIKEAERMELPELASYLKRSQEILARLNDVKQKRRSSA